MRVLREARAGRVLDALVDRKNRQVTCACQPSRVVQPIEMIEDALIAVAWGENPIHPVRTRQMQKLGRNGLAGVLEKVLGSIAE
jgi:hypothetical protein